MREATHCGVGQCTIRAAHTSADDDELAAEGLIVAHKIAERRIERLEMVAVSHGALVPEQELSTSEELGGGRLGIDVEHLVGRRLAAGLAARVKGAAELEEDGGNPRGGDCKGNAASGTHTGEEGVGAESLPCPTGSIHKDAAAIVILDGIERSIDCSAL